MQCSCPSMHRATRAGLLIGTLDPQALEADVEQPGSAGYCVSGGQLNAGTVQTIHVDVREASSGRRDEG